MNDTIARGPRSLAGFDDGDAAGDDWSTPSRPFRPLTPAQAEQVRSSNPPVSPWRVVAAQAVAGSICVVVAWLWSRQSSVAASAFYGMAASVVPSALLARGMTRRMRSAVAAAAGFMFWEMLKIGAAVALMVIAARVVPQLSWPVLLVTMLVCMKVNWVALLWRGR